MESRERKASPSDLFKDTIGNDRKKLKEERLDLAQGIAPDELAEIEKTPGYRDLSLLYRSIHTWHKSLIIPLNIILFASHFVSELHCWISQSESSQNTFMLLQAQPSSYSFPPVENHLISGQITTSDPFYLSIQAHVVYGILCTGLGKRNAFITNDEDGGNRRSPKASAAFQDGLQIRLGLQILMFAGGHCPSHQMIYNSAFVEESGWIACHRKRSSLYKSWS